MPLENFTGFISPQSASQTAPPLGSHKIIKKLFLFLQIGCIIYKDYSAAFAANCEGVKNR